MRELPEPYWKISDAFARDQVLAIQRQAYEDGLRAAARMKAGKVRTLSKRGSGSLLDEQQFCFSMGWKEGAASVRKNIAAMLTASQEPK